MTVVSRGDPDVCINNNPPSCCGVERHLRTARASAPKLDLAAISGVVKAAELPWSLSVGRRKMATDSDCAVTGYRLIQL